MVGKDQELSFSSKISCQYDFSGDVFKGHDFPWRKLLHNSSKNTSREHWIVETCFPPQNIKFDNRKYPQQELRQSPSCRQTRRNALGARPSKQSQTLAHNATHKPRHNTISPSEMRL